MRTKTLLLTAAVLAAGLGASMAQSVFSVNAVGYVNVPILPGYNLIANPLNGTNNLISTVIPVAPDSTVLYHFNRATQHYYSTDTYFSFPPPDDADSGWYDEGFARSTTVLAPGEGFFIRNSGSATNVTFVGDVPQGNLTNTIAHFYGFYSSMVPQSGTLASLGLAAPNDSTVFRSWNAAQQKYNGSLTYFVFPPPDDVDNGWYNDSFIRQDPSLGVAEGCLIYNPSGAIAWGRTFSVN